MEQYSHRDLIDLYLDGELPADQHGALFSALASSDELQAEFHQALTLRIAALQEAQQLLPSPAVTARILAAAAPPQRSVITAGKRLWRSVVVRTTTIVASAAAIGFVIGRLTVPLPDKTAAIDINQRPVHTVSPALQHSLPVTSASYRQLPASPAAHALDSIHPPNTRLTEDIVSIEDTLLPHSKPSLIPQQRLPIEPITNQIPSTVSARSWPRWEIILPDAHDSELILSVRRTNTILLRQQQLVQPIASSPLANTIVSLEYRQQNVGVFVQAGFEQFPIYEVATTPDGLSRYTLRQQLWWIGGGMRAYLPLGEGHELLRTLRPVAGIMLGTSAYGILGRGEVGLVWEPLPSVGVQFLLEGMVHSHSAGTSWEHAEKLSGSIGLAFRF